MNQKDSISFNSFQKGLNANEDVINTKGEKGNVEYSNLDQDFPFPEKEESDDNYYDNFYN